MGNQESSSSKDENLSEQEKQAVAAVESVDLQDNNDKTPAAESIQNDPPAAASAETTAGAQEVGEKSIQQPLEEEGEGVEQTLSPVAAAKIEPEPSPVEVPDECVRDEGPNNNATMEQAPTATTIHAEGVEQTLSPVAAESIPEPVFVPDECVRERPNHAVMEQAPTATTVSSATEANNNNEQPMIMEVEDNIQEGKESNEPPSPAAAVGEAAVREAVVGEKPDVAKAVEQTPAADTTTSAGAQDNDVQPMDVEQENQEGTQQGKGEPAVMETAGGKQEVVAEEAPAAAGAASATEPMEVENQEEKETKDDAVDDSADNISLSSSTISTDTGENDIITTEKANEKLLRAAQYKEEGNTFFKQQDLDKAARAYRRGCNALKPLRNNPAHADDAQVTSLLVALQANLCMVCFKQQKLQHCIQIATKALSLDPTNVKVLYRRAAAQRQSGHLTEARADLRTALQHDPTNKACKKELLAVKQELERTTAAQKKALAKAFGGSLSGGNSFLYQDKAAAEQKRQEQAAEKKQREQDLYKKRKVEWEDECVSRMARNEPAISFEDWAKEQKEAEDKKQKEEEEKQKEELKLIQEERKKAKEFERQQRREQQMQDGKDGDDSDDDDEPLTKEELASLRGYKKTSDGRTTSYFNRELSEDEKRAIGDIAPKRLDTPATAAGATAAAATATAMSGPALLSKSSPTEGGGGGAAGASAWNKAGTWEEKDTTGWCSDELTRRLQATIAVGVSSAPTTTINDDTHLSAAITSVEELTGHASVALTGGKKRYIFDFHGKLEYEVKTVPPTPPVPAEAAEAAAPAQDAVGENSEGNNTVNESTTTTKPVVVAKGVVRLPDICSTDHEELEVTFESWKKKPTAEMASPAMEMRNVLADELRKTVKLWVQAFNEQY